MTWRWWFRDGDIGVCGCGERRPLFTVNDRRRCVACSINDILEIPVKTDDHIYMTLLTRDNKKGCILYKVFDKLKHHRKGGRQHWL